MANSLVLIITRSPIHAIVPVWISKSIVLGFPHPAWSFLGLGSGLLVLKSRSTGPPHALNRKRLSRLLQIWHCYNFRPAYRLLVQLTRTVTDGHCD